MKCRAWLRQPGGCGYLVEITAGHDEVARRRGDQGNVERSGGPLDLVAAGSWERQSFLAI